MQLKPIRSSHTYKRRRTTAYSVALLATACVSSCRAMLQVTWPALEQCRPAVALLQPSPTDGIASYEVTVRRLPRLDRIYYMSELAPTASNWTWRAVDLPAGTTVVLSIVGLSVDNATTASAITHAEVGFPLDGIVDEACITRRTRHDRGKHDGGSTLGIIAGVLGGILFVLMLLVVFMCYRRRREANSRAAEVHPSATNARLDQSPEGDAGGWGYMSTMVPGLPRNQLTQGALEQINNDVSRPSALQAARAWARRRASRDLELPTYGRSQWEKAKLPKYDAEGANRSPLAAGDPIALRPLLNPSTVSVNVLGAEAPPPHTFEPQAAHSISTSIREAGQQAHVRSRSGAYAQRGELDGSASLDSNDAPIAMPHRRTRTEGALSSTAGTPRMGHAPSSSTSIGNPRRYI